MFSPSGLEPMDTNVDGIAEALEAMTEVGGARLHGRFPIRLHIGCPVRYNFFTL